MFVKNCAVSFCCCIVICSLNDDIAKVTRDIGTYFTSISDFGFN